MEKDVKVSTQVTQVTKELKNLANLTNDYIQHAKSENTKKAYNSDWRDFEFWCKNKKLQALPCSPHSVAAYLADRATNSWVDKNKIERPPLKIASLIRRLTSISQVHASSEVEFDRGNPVIQQTLKGIKKQIGSFQIRKEPILIEDLRKMIESISIEQFGQVRLKGIRDRSLFLIGFSGAFRRAELVSLKINDFKFTREGVIVFLRKSKTDQYASGREIAIPYGSNPLTCPVRSLDDWIKVSQITEGHLFRPINRHGHIGKKGLTGHAIAYLIKENFHLKDCFKNYSGHSLRSGFVTEAALSGVPEHIIMRQTGHKKSDTIKKYIRIGNMWQENAASKVGL